MHENGADDSFPFLNRAAIPQTQQHKTTPPEQYDLNFAPATTVPRLSNTNVELRPFIPSIHAEIFFKYYSTKHDVGPALENMDQVYAVFERTRADSASICYAIFVNPASFADLPADAPRCLEDPTASGKARSWLYAGFMPHRKFEALNGEYGVSVIPCFQGHKVGAQAVALTLDWFFRLPKDGGLGLRKVSASLYHSNEISKKFHDFLGFRREGLMRAQRLGKPGDSWNDFPGREGDPEWPRPSYSSIWYGLTYIDWEEGGIKERLEKIKRGEPVPRATSVITGPQ